MKRQIGEYLDLDLSKELWCCHTCGKELISARENFKKGCLVYEREPKTIQPSMLEDGLAFSPDPDYVTYVEFYCPGCGQMIDMEAIPPGHPITHDIELDLDRLKAKYLES